MQLQNYAVLNLKNRAFSCMTEQCERLHGYCSIKQTNKTIKQTSIFFLINSQSELQRQDAKTKRLFHFLQFFFLYRYLSKGNFFPSVSHFCFIQFKLKPSKSANKNAVTVKHTLAVYILNQPVLDSFFRVKLKVKFSHT